LDFLERKQKYNEDPVKNSDRRNRTRSMDFKHNFLCKFLPPSSYCMISK
jgi:hypothetical protein